MTAGAIIQLISASGAQDTFLSENPQITYFKTVYKRHTNFALDTTEEVFYNTSENFGKQCRCIIPRKGDLVSNITLYIKLGTLNPDFYNRIEKNKTVKHKPVKNKIDKDGRRVRKDCICSRCTEERYKNTMSYGWTNSLGHALIKSAWIEIGGKKIDRQYGEWLEIWSELTLTNEKQNAYNKMIGKVPQATFTATTFTGCMELYVPLNFWFSRSSGLALPVLALYYHSVELVVDFREFDECWVTNRTDIEPPERPDFEASVLVDYVYLDSDERKKFYEESHMYLIEQVQSTGCCPVLGSTANITMCFNHPVKMLTWVVQRADVTKYPSGVYTGSNYPLGNDWFNFSTFQTRDTAVLEDTFDTGVVQFNGVDRFDVRKASYFRLYQPYFHNTNSSNNYIYVYSFGINPEECTPSGYLNFSRVDNAKLVLNMDKLRPYTEYGVTVYGLGYNVLIVSGGLGGLLYST